MVSGRPLAAHLRQGLGRSQAQSWVADSQHRSMSQLQGPCPLRKATAVPSITLLVGLNGAALTVWETPPGSGSYSEQPNIEEQDLAEVLVPDDISSFRADLPN